MKGLTFTKNKKNSFIVARLHYTADPERAKPEWKLKTRPGYTEATWRKEYEIDFEALSGLLVYPMFDESVHLISRRDLDIDKLNTRGIRIRVLDHGGTNPTACLWAWIDPDDNWIIYREYYKANDVIPNHAREIKQRSQRESYYNSIADPSIWAKTREKDGERYSIQEEYSDLGIDWSKGNNDFALAWDTISQRLTIDPSRINPFTGLPGSPSIFFVQEECINLVKEIKKWRFQEFTSVKMALEKNPKEVPIDKDNHAMDCLTYLANEIKPDISIEKEKELTIVQKDIKKAMNIEEEKKDKLLDIFNQDDF